MKHTIIILLVAVLAAGAGLTSCSASTRKTETETAATIKKEAQHKKVNSGAVTDLIREYNLTEGFEAVSVGGLGLGLIRMIANASMDEEERAALELMDELRRIVVLDYEDADVANEHFLYDGLIKGKTHCDGTANMYSLLLNLAGVENFERSYDGGEDKAGHTWNALKLDGVWYNTDATALRDREDFEFRTKRTFAVEDRLMSYPSTVDAVYPAFDKNLRFSLIEADSISVKELSREMCDRI